MIDHIAYWFILGARLAINTTRFDNRGVRGDEEEAPIRRSLLPPSNSNQFVGRGN